MLKTLDSQLRSLAQTKDGEFRAAISKRLNGKTTEDQIKTLKEFIFLIPPVLNQLTIYWNDKKTPAEIKRLSGLILTYVFHPDNLISEKGQGLFGYIDDAYLVVSTFLRIEDLSIKDWHDKSQDELNLLQRCRDLIAAPKLIIPEETAKIDRLINSMMSGNTKRIEANFMNQQVEMMSDKD